MGWNGVPHACANWLLGPKAKFATTPAEQMREGFRTINALEKSTVEKETTVNHRDIYFYFLIAAVFAAILFLASAALIREDA